jgi:hypothetical protein
VLECCTPTPLGGSPSRSQYELKQVERGSGRIDWARRDLKSGDKETGALSSLAASVLNSLFMPGLGRTGRSKLCSVSYST